MITNNKIPRTQLESEVSQTITNGVTNKAPSEDAVFDALTLKLTSSNNLSELNNALTARNNLGIWNIFLINGNQTTTSNVASDITELVTPTLSANIRYRITGIIRIGCNNTGGVKIAITIPTGATMGVSVHGFTTSSNGTLYTLISSSGSLISTPYCAVNSTSGMLFIDGEFDISSTSGVAQFSFASSTNTQTSTIFQRGTQLQLTKIN